jgi:hypothetical protein
VHRAQVIEINIHKTGANILNFPILFQDNGKKDLEEKIDEGYEKNITSNFVPETESESPNVSIQEEYYMSHAPWEGNFDLSYAKFESNDHNDFKDGFKEPPLDVHEDFIQYNHGENVATGSQLPQLIYINLKEEFLHWMNKSDVNDQHFTSKSKFQVVDFSYGAEFNEEDIFQASKEEGNMQQEVPWVVYFIF